MALYQRGGTTGSPAVDREIDRIWRAMSGRDARQSTSSGSVVVNPYYMQTNIGGHAYLVENLSGVLLPKGYLVKVSSLSTGLGITTINMDDYGGEGAVWEDIPAYSTTGYVVMMGPADIYFNSNGATAGQIVRMSREDDTVNIDTCKAQSDSIRDVDAGVEMIGTVTVSRSGEGLSRCFIKR